MSIKKWEEIAKQKQEVEDQRKNILNPFKQKKKLKMKFVYWKLKNFLSQ